MILHQDISKNDFTCLLLAYFKDNKVGEYLSASYVFDYANVIYDLKQFCITDEGYFVTWGFLSDENEKIFLSADDTVFNPLSFYGGNNLWVLDCQCDPKRLGTFFKKSLSYLPPGKFDRFKTLLLNKYMKQDFREVKIVQRI